MVVFEDVTVDEITKRRKRKSASIQDNESPRTQELEQETSVHEGIPTERPFRKRHLQRGTQISHRRIPVIQ